MYWEISILNVKYTQKAVNTKTFKFSSEMLTEFCNSSFLKFTGTIYKDTLLKKDTLNIFQAIYIYIYIYINKYIYIYVCICVCIYIDYILYNTIYIYIYIYYTIHMRWMLEPWAIELDDLDIQMSNSYWQLSSIASR